MTNTERIAILPDMGGRYPNGFDPSQLTDIVSICQDEYCAAEHCDLGGGDCQVCVQVRAGAHLCGYCGQEMPDQPRTCG